MIRRCEVSQPTIRLPFRGSNKALKPGWTVERPMAVTAWTALLLVLVLAIADATRSGEEFESVIYGSKGMGIAVLVVGIVCLLVVMKDLHSYRPRLLDESDPPAERLFYSLSELSPSLKEQVGAIDDASPSTWQEVKELEQNLLAETHEFLLFESLRSRITFRVLLRIASLVASLALVGYGLSTLTDGGLLRGDTIAPGTPLLDHVYFTLVAFFTGFGDIQLVHNAIGYAYLALTVMAFTGVVYFILTDVVAIRTELRHNMRAAAEAFVVQRSSL